MKGRICVAGADKDNSDPLEMVERLEKALSNAGVDHRCEIYPGALHGWTTAETSLSTTRQLPAPTGADC